MNVKRFVGKTSHEALQRLKQALGPDAVVLSTRPCAEGIELLAMGPEAAPRTAAEVAADVRGDAQTLSMSTLSFQDYVRDRMLKRRQEEMKARASERASEPAPRPAPASGGLHERAQAQLRSGGRDAQDVSPVMHAALHAAARQTVSRPTPSTDRVARAQASQGASSAAPGSASGGASVSASVGASGGAFVHASARSPEHEAMLEEIRSMKGLIEARFSALTFLERLQRHPAQARLAQRLLDAGFSPALSRKLTEMLPQDAPNEERWAQAALERNLKAAEQMPAIEELGGVIALVGATGVGKTTTTAKIAAAHAARHGTSSLGLITLDAYRVGAQEQLRTYGRILGVPVHSAHDRASLEDLLEMLSDKRLVLVDTAGMAQRDSRTREMLDMLSHPSIQRVLVLSAAAQGETLDDVVLSWRAAGCKGVVLSKVDEAVRLAPALDTLIRQKLPVLGVANGQRVPEDWHRLTAQALVQRALRDTGRSHWRLDAQSVELVFAEVPHAPFMNRSSAAGVAGLERRP